MKNHISIGSDHAGFELKEKIKSHLTQLNLSVFDKGSLSKESCDYADFAHAVCKDVTTKKADIGILICGSGNGINMTANKWNDIRSALCWNKEITEMARLHNDANVLVLPGRYISESDALSCVDIFLKTAFEGGRHQNRINKIKITDESNNFFFIPKTDKTPHVSINKEISKMEIEGRSIPENSIHFYKQVIQEIDKFNFDKLTLNIDLEYFNSSSNKTLFEMLKHLKDKIENLDINWFVDDEDEDLIEHVETLKKLFNINLVIKQNV